MKENTEKGEGVEYKKKREPRAVENFGEILSTLTKEKGVKIKDVSFFNDISISNLKNKNRHSEIKFYQIENFIRMYDIEPNILFWGESTDTVNISAMELDALREKISELSGQVQALSDTINNLTRK